MKNYPRSNTALSTYVSQICTELEISYFKLAEALRLSPDVLWKELKKDDSSRCSVVSRIADYLDTSMDSLILRQVSIQQLKDRRSDKAVLPGKYLVGAGSTVRTLLPVLKQLESTQNYRLRRYLVRELGINEALLRNPDQEVSIRLLTDALALLRQRGLGEADFFNMGLQTSRLPENARIAQLLSGSKGPADVYECIVEGLSRAYERNYEYSLVKRTQNSVTMRVVAREEIQEALGSDVIDSRWVALYRQGVASAQPCYIGLPATHVNETSCVHLGDAETTFELQWR